MFAGSSGEFTIVAKDAKGVRKSLGGDVFTVTWRRAGCLDPPMTGRVRPSYLDPDVIFDTYVREGESRIMQACIIALLLADRGSDYGRVCVTLFCCEGGSLPGQCNARRCKHCRQPLCRHCGAGCH